MTISTTKLRDKNIIHCFGRTFIRTVENNRFYDITPCEEPLHDGTLDDYDGVLIDAVPVSAEFVADIVGHAEAIDEIIAAEEAEMEAEARRRDESLARLQSLLELNLLIRRRRSRMATQRYSLLKLQQQKKKEAII